MSEYMVWSNTDTGQAINESLVKEQVEDLIINLFPLDTPLHQVCGTMPMRHVFMQQPIDTYGTGATGIRRTSEVFLTSGGSFSVVAAKPEGFTYTSGTPQYPAKLKSVAEIQGVQFGVTDTDRAVSMYGLADRFAYEALKTTQTVVNNFEHSFWWSPGTPESGSQLHTGGGVDVARQTQGVVHWICKSGLQRSKIGLTANNFTDGHGNDFGDFGGASPGTLGAGASSWAYDAAGLPLDQSMFKDNLMAKWYDITGRQGGAVGFAGSRIKNLFSQFALTANGAINERTLEAAAKRVVDAVDYYETDFGVVSLNLCRYLNLAMTAVAISQSAGSTTVVTDEVLLFMHPQYFKRGILRPVYMSPIGKTGDFEQGLVRGEQAMICLNPQAGAAIVNCVP